MDNSTVCPGAVKEMGDIILPVLSESLLDPEFFCTEFLGYCSTSYYMFYAEDYVEKLLATKPEAAMDNNYLNTIYSTVRGETRKILTAVQISDPHVDF